MSQQELEQLLARLLQSPKQISMEGFTLTERSVSEIKELLSLLTKLQADKNKKTGIKIWRIVNDDRPGQNPFEQFPC